MITSLRSLLIGSALLTAPQITSASILLGISDFTTTQIPSGTGNVEEPGFTGGFAFSGSAFGAAPGGSDDNTWGSLSPSPDAPPANNGTTTANLEVGSGTLVVSLQSPVSQGLGYLLFDAAAQFSGALLDITYTITPAPLGSGDLTDPNPIPLTAVGGFGVPVPTTGYESFLIDISNIVLGPGQTIAFTFLMSSTTSPVENYAYLDNIAITSIPEPGSMLGLGCVAGAGAFLRSRRRRG